MPRYALIPLALALAAGCSPGGRSRTAAIPATVSLNLSVGKPDGMLHINYGYDISPPDYPVFASLKAQLYKGGGAVGLSLWMMDIPPGHYEITWSPFLLDILEPGAAAAKWDAAAVLLEVTPDGEDTHHAGVVFHE